MHICRSITTSEPREKGTFFFLFEKGGIYKGLPNVFLSRMEQGFIAFDLRRSRFVMAAKSGIRQFV
jgi:hypothetical protein